MFRWDATGALGNVSAPVLVIGGALDIVTKPEASQTLATGDGLTIVSDVNHMGFIERAEIYNDLIMRFADKVQRREPEIVNAAFGVAAPTRD